MSYNSKNLKKLIASTLLTSTFALAPMVSAENFDENISTYESEMNGIDGEISELQEKGKQIQAELDILNEDIALNESKKAESQTLINETTEKLNRLNQEIASLEEVISERQAQIDEQARTVQIDGNPTNYITFIIDAESLTDAFNRFTIVDDMIDANTNNVQEQKDDKETVQAKHVEAEDTLALHQSTFNELQMVSNELDEQKLTQEVMQNQVALTKADKESERVAIQGYLDEAIAARDAYQEEQRAIAEAEAEAQRVAEAEAQAAEEAAQAAQVAEAEAKEAAQVAAEQAENEVAQQKAAEAEEAAQVAQEKVETTQPKVASKVTSNSSSSSSTGSSSSSSSNTGSGSVNAAPAQAPAPAPSSSQLGWPAASSSVSSEYGYRIHPIQGYNKLHAGMDITGGGAIYAANGGTVTHAGYHYSFGNYIDISHGNGMTTRYAHLSSMNVSPGQTVSRGQNIGVMGTTGSSTGVHLHFEVLINGVQVNPRNYL